MGYLIVVHIQRTPQGGTLRAFISDYSHGGHARTFMLADVRWTLQGPLSARAALLEAARALVDELETPSSA